MSEPGREDYLTWNRSNWDDRAVGHATSAGYDLARFRRDPDALSDVVTFDLPRLGSVAGLRGVHLQCHLGTDTLSLARLGAQMTGLDFSEVAVRHARQLAADTSTAVEYVCAPVDDALGVLPAGGFDLVYTGIGALCWLPRIEDWARVVAGLLAPGGRLHLREGHPVLWAVAEPDSQGRLALSEPYFEVDRPQIFDDDSTYVESDHQITATRTAEWNHGLGEIVTALLDHGLQLTTLVEHRSVPYPALGALTVPDPHHPGEWVLAEGADRLPLSYTLQASKPG